MLPIRATTYFRQTRDDVLAQVPESARTILDLGCGAGVLGGQLRARQACAVWGIECDPDAAREARDRLDRVIETPIEAAIPQLPAGHFDTLIAADVLEHLPDPWAALRALTPVLAPGAAVIVSLPNVQHHGVLRDLLRGRFVYAPEGILDQTHLRFFTRASGVELLRRAGFAVEHIIPVYNGGRDRRAARRRQQPADLPPLPGDALADFYATQFLFVARAPTPAPDTSRLRVSIVMLTFNRLDMTQKVMASLRTTTAQPYELIIVDNGSRDGTVGYLEQLASEQVRVIYNPDNRGVAAGWNQGLRVATGDCLMVLNNDVLVSGDWLARMTRAAHESPTVGLVGCRTNAVSGPQALTPDYTDVHDFPLFARKYAGLADGSWFELPRIVAFALLWRRDVYERLGEFDEQFMPANFEDDDYAWRARQAGYRNIVANDVFIHHAGAASHSANDLSARDLVQRNRQRFVAKWDTAAAAVLAAASWASYEQHVGLLAPEQYALPLWALPDLPPRALAHHLAQVGRRLGRLGWRRQARAWFQRSLRKQVTLRGCTGWLGNLRPDAGGAPRVETLG